MRLGIAISLLIASFLGITRDTHAQKAPSNAPRDSASQHSLEITSITREQIRGRLTSGRIGVIFDSRKDGNSLDFELTTLSGRKLVTFKTDGDSLITSIYDGRQTGTMPRTALGASGRAIAKSPQQSDTQREKKVDVGARREAAKQFQDQVTAATTLRGDPKAARDLSREPEYALLPALSWELGKLGITGPRYPPSAAIHVLGSTAAKALRVDPRHSGVVYRKKLPSSLKVPRPTFGKGEVVVDPCADPANRAPAHDESGNQGPRRAPNQTLDRDKTPSGLFDAPKCVQCERPIENDCFGMCGPGCSDCWDFLCGDCCYHEFCAAHDTALRACENAYNPFGCFFAFTGPGVLNTWLLFKC